MDDDRHGAVPDSTDPDSNPDTWLPEYGILGTVAVLVRVAAGQSGNPPQPNRDQSDVALTNRRKPTALLPPYLNSLFLNRSSNRR